MLTVSYLLQRVNLPSGLKLKGILSISDITRSTHKTQCVHFPGLFSLWGGVVSPSPQTHTKQKVHTHLQNPGYATVNPGITVHFYEDFLASSTESIVISISL